MQRFTYYKVKGLTLHAAQLNGVNFAAHCTVNTHEQDLSNVTVVFAVGIGTCLESATVTLAWCATTVCNDPHNKNCNFY